ncbi:hypothetical protein, partial [uncultured Nocardioides sp.]|uniref:hypothetical protein n=1 Tax=uncultured Nocardioides sp. TaxID=198441 RepID=UPI002601B70E
MRAEVEAGAGAISRLIDHFGLEACPLIGINAGVVPVVRFAATNPGRVSALGNIGGYLPLATSQQRKHLAINHRIFFNVTSVAPLAADYMARLAWRNARDLGIMVRQAEDEIAVANMAIGAAHTGVRAMCAPSGG